MSNKLNISKNIVSKIYVSLHDFLYIKIYAISLLILLPLALSWSSFANTTNEDKVIKISNKYNFLSLENQNIKSIIGDASTFNVQKLDDKILFIPKTKSASISIISSSGDIQKLHLNVSPISPQNIILPIPKKPIKQHKELEEKSIKFFNKILKNLVQFEPVSSKAYKVPGLIDLNLRVKYEGYFTHKELIANVFTIYLNQNLGVDKITDSLLNEIVDKNVFYISRQNRDSNKLIYKHNPQILFSLDKYLSKNKKHKIIIIGNR